jgi:hypothetical protein
LARALLFDVERVELERCFFVKAKMFEFLVVEGPSVFWLDERRKGFFQCNVIEHTMYCMANVDSGRVAAKLWC